MLLDVRWTLAGSDRDGYLAAHIPGAVFVDLDRSWPAPPGPGGRHPLPDPADLQAAWRAAGIDDDSSVVVYDGGSGLASARAWWLLRWSGLRDVRVLDGGFAGLAGGRPAGRRLPARSSPDGRERSPSGRAPCRSSTVDRAAELAVVRRADRRPRGGPVPRRDRAARPGGRAHPRPVNLPIADLLTAAGTFRPAAELAAAFAGSVCAGGPRTAQVAASCGSGITACQLILAGEVAGLELALYPGSYSQWCALDRPVAVGA